MSRQPTEQPGETLSTIEVGGESIKFCAAHFTIFSSESRERLHGHNFRVRVAVTAPVGADGLAFNYRDIKLRIRALCEELDEYTLLPAASPHLSISDEGKYLNATFNGEQLYFLKADTKVLPIRNTTVEELAAYLLSRLRADEAFVNGRDLRRIDVGVSSGPGQWGSCTWEAGA